MEGYGQRIIDNTTAVQVSEGGNIAKELATFAKLSKQELSEAADSLKKTPEGIIGALEKMGMSTEGAQIFFADSMQSNVENSFNVISSALRIEARQIESIALAKSLHKVTAGLIDFEKVIDNIANKLSSDFEEISGYFKDVASLTETAFQQNLTQAKTVGTISPAEYDRQSLDFQINKVQAQGAMDQEGILKEFIKATRDADLKDEDIGSATVKEIRDSIIKFGTGGDESELLRRTLQIASRQGITDADKKELGRQATEEGGLISKLAEISNHTKLSAAELVLANRLNEQNRVLGGIPAATQMSSEQVFDFQKMFGAIPLQGNKSITSQDQLADFTLNMDSFMKARNIERSPEFAARAMDAQQSKLLTNSARIIHSIAGRGFVRPEDPNYGFGTPEGMEDFFNVENLSKNAPTVGAGDVANQGFVKKLNTYFDQQLTPEKKPTIFKQTSI